jgi:hypothetical protein
MAKNTQIFIPIVTGPPEARAARLWEVGCRHASLSETASARMLDDKKIEPTLHFLGKLNRYKSGMNGLGAVRRLLRDTSPDGGAADDFDLEEALRNRRLVSAEGAAWGGTIEEHSSDLGLGLALLLHLAQTQPAVLAATGGLGNAEDAKSDYDLPVTPVRDVPAKLQAMLEKKRGGGVLGELACVFTPQQYYAGDGELAWVEQLPVVEALRQAGVRVHPVGSFGAAAQILGIEPNTRARLRRELLASETRRRWLRRAAFGLPLALLLLVSGGLARFLIQPIALEWRPLTRAAAQAEPYLLCFDRAGQADSRRALAKFGPAAAPIAPVSGRLAWDMRAGGLEEAASWQNKLLRSMGYGGYYLAVVLVGKDSGITDNAVFIPKQTASGSAPVRLPAGAVWSYSLALDGQAEESRLLILANRLKPFDSEALKTRLKQRFQPRAGGLDLPAVEHYLAEQANVILHFPFQTLADAEACPARP